MAAIEWCSSDGVVEWMEFPRYLFVAEMKLIDCDGQLSLAPIGWREQTMNEYPSIDRIDCSLLNRGEIQRIETGKTLKLSRFGESASKIDYCVAHNSENCVLQSVCCYWKNRSGLFVLSIGLEIIIGRDVAQRWKEKLNYTNNSPMSGIILCVRKRLSLAASPAILRSFFAASLPVRLLAPSPAKQATLIVCTTTCSLQVCIATTITTK